VLQSEIDPRARLDMLLLFRLPCGVLKTGQDQAALAEVHFKITEFFGEASYQ
jgi:hypothetical protein